MSVVFSILFNFGVKNRIMDKQNIYYHILHVLRPETKMINLLLK